MLEQSGTGVTSRKLLTYMGVAALAVGAVAFLLWRTPAAALAALPAGAAPLLYVLMQRQARLEKMLLQGPTRHGYATELWTCPRVAQLIQKRFGVRYDDSGVWHLLNRLGWSCQKPQRRAREQDEDAVATWRKKDWPRIKKRAT